MGSLVHRSIVLEPFACHSGSSQVLARLGSRMRYANGVRVTDR